MRAIRRKRNWWSPGWWLTGGGGGLSSVQTDATITGSGTLASPLSIAGMLTVGPIASRPASGQASGAIYRCTDSPYEFWWTGAAWQAFAYGFPVVPPVLANFTQVNVSRSTLDTTHGGILQSVTGAGATNDVQVLAQAIPASGAYFLDVAFTYFSYGVNDCAGPGIMSGALASSAIEAAQWGWPGGTGAAIDVLSWPNTTSGASVQAGPFGRAYYAPMDWIRIQDDRTNLTYFESSNGYTWSQFFQHARGSILTPASCGLVCNPFNGAQNIHWLHYSVHT